MPTSGPGILLVFAATNRHSARSLRAELASEGFRLIEPLLGVERSKAFGSALKDSEIILVCLSKDAGTDRVFLEETVRALESRKPIIPVYFEALRLIEEFPPSISHVLSEYSGVVLDNDNEFYELARELNRLIEGLSFLSAPSFLARRERPAASQALSLRIRRLHLKNIRCFEDFTLDLASESDQPILLTMILGDNASGKSTLLRSIALGLSSESEASALIKQLPGSLVRRGAEEGSLKLELFDPKSSRELTITTRILRNGTTDERVRKETEPDPFPWEDVFVCAYGTNRSRQAAASYESYTLHQAVLPLFDDDAVLQNPELVLLRMEPRLRAKIEKRLLRILMLDEPDYEVTLPRTGPEIRGPWGDQPFQSLSDGYRSTTQWVLDFLAWSIYAGRLKNGGDIGGILLVDELEQHLHPRWQRHIVQRLRQQLQGTQIFASTHTPLAAAGAADVEGARIIRLRTDADDTVRAVDVDPKSLDGLRADQVLASEAFGLHTSRNPGSEDDIARYAELLGKEKLTKAEKAEMKRLKSSLSSALQTGETEVERQVEQAVETALRERVAGVKPEMVDLEVRRQLHELFAGEKAG